MVGRFIVLRSQNLTIKFILGLKFSVKFRSQNLTIKFILGLKLSVKFRSFNWSIGLTAMFQWMCVPLYLRDLTVCDAICGIYNYKSCLLKLTWHTTFSQISVSGDSCWHLLRSTFFDAKLEGESSLVIHCFFFFFEISLVIHCLFILFCILFYLLVQLISVKLIESIFLSFSSPSNLSQMINSCS